jgi:hypothetical protein
MISHRQYQGEDGYVTICQVRSASNPLGEHWHVHLTSYDTRANDGSCTDRGVYSGPDSEQAWTAYEAAKTQV